MKLTGGAVLWLSALGSINEVALHRARLLYAQCLRSANKNLLAVPSSRTILTDRAFSRAAPIVWNALPSRGG